MLIGIIVAVIGVVVQMPTQYESLLWIGILGTQSIPYVSAVACALISGLCAARTIRPVGSEGTSDLHSFEVAAVVPARPRPAREGLRLSLHRVASP